MNRRLLSDLSRIAAIIGTTVNEMTREPSMTTQTVVPMSPMKRPKLPGPPPPLPKKMSGTNTHIVVIVEQMIGIATSLAPPSAAVFASAPSSWRCRKIDSMTTIELSSSIPIASIKPIRLITFSVISVTPAWRPRYIITKVMTKDSGTARATRSVVRNLRRNRNMKTIARPPPMRPLRPSSVSPCRTSIEVSWKWRNSRPWPSGVCRMASSSALTRLTTSSRFASDALLTLRLIASTPLRKLCSYLSG